MRAIKRLILIPMLVDNIIMQTLKNLFPKRHKIQGKCKTCGSCCREILLKMSKSQMKSKFFTALVVRWLSWLYDFYLLKIDYDRGYLAFSCHHKGKDGRCMNYKWRPPVCRNFPLLDYFEEPSFISGCGFRGAKK